MSYANPNRPETIEYHQPVGIFGIKTRIAFNWEIKNRKARSTKRYKSPTQRKQKYYANFIVRKRGLIDYEWNKAVTEVPRSSDAIQLDLYSKGLTRVYREITGDMSCDDIVKGIILVDTQQDIAVNRDVIFTMIEYLKNKDVIKKVQAGCDRLLIRGKHPVASRTSIVLVNPTEKELIPFQTQGVGLIEKAIFTPFRYSSETNST